MSLESIIAGMELKKRNRQLSNTRRIKYTEEMLLTENAILRLGKRNGNLYFVLEEKKKKRIIASFINAEKPRFQTYYMGGTDVPFDIPENIEIVKKMGNDGFMLNGKNCSVEIYGEQDALMAEYVSRDNRMKTVLWMVS